MSEENTQYVNRAGVYLCRVEKPMNGWFGEAGENETPYLRVPVRVLEQKDGKDDQVGRTITWQGWLTEGAFDRTIKSVCEAFPPWDGNLETLSNDRYGFEGLECEIVADSETFEGKTRVKAKWLNPVGGGGGKPMDKGKIGSLISKLGRKSMAIAKSVRSESGAAPAPAPSRPPARTFEEPDDIPF